MLNDIIGFTKWNAWIYFQEPHFWTLCTDKYIGALKLELMPEADARYVTHRSQQIFQAIGVNNLHVHLDFTNHWHQQLLSIRL